ncbi:putative metal-binding motif-containing protein [Archangium sp.]|uniref:putative metal-binding motif-containing protein n=1 Tax=Archangium sp. TaxID=1872627 RepID=UPI00389A4771
MSALSKLLLLSCLACTAACIVPTIEEVEEQEGPAGCDDADHKCPESFVCYENRCIQLTSDMVCKPGVSEACDTNGLGECKAGARQCGAEGTFGVCESKKKPVFERCDGLDNNCDGPADNWNDPLPLSKSLDSGSTLAAIAVRRAPDGSQDTLLVLESEAGNLVARTLAPDGTLKQGTTFMPTSAAYNFRSPSLAADGDTVAAAWVEQGTVSSSSDYRVKLTLLDGSGSRAVSQVLELPYASATVSRVKAAINMTHVLVAVTYTPSSTSTDVTAVYTVPRNEFTPTAVRGPNKIAAHRGGFGLDATANGTGNAFLVAFEDAGVRKTVIVKNDGSLTYAAGAAITQNGSTHSPFIAPLKDDPVRHVVFYVANAVTGSGVTSQLLGVGCGDQACSLEPTVVGSTDSNIESMVMARRPGMQGPESALGVWTDPASGQRRLLIGTLGSSGVKDWLPLRPPGNNTTLSEALVVMPDSTRFLAYNQLAPSLAVGYASEGYLLPFCGP